MKIRKYLPICIALVLTGCKVELTTIVNMDDVLSRETIRKSPPILILRWQHAMIMKTRGKSHKA